MDQTTGKIIGVSVAGFLAFLLWVARRGRPTIISDDGSLLFRHSLAFRGYSLVAAFGIPLAITVLLFVKPPKNQEDVLAVLGIYALFAALGLPLWWEASRYALILTPEGLDCRSPWRGSQFIAWEDVEEISFSSFNRWFIVKARYGRTFRIPIFVSGVSEFLARCEQQLPAALLVKARAGYMQVGRRIQ